MRKIKSIFCIILALIVFICMPLTVGAQDFRLDSETLQRGYTVRSPDDRFWIGVMPGYFEGEMSISVNLISEMQTPGHLRPASSFYEMSVQGQNTVLAEPLLLSFKFYSRNTNLKSIYYYDHYQGQWRILPSQIDYQNNLIRTQTHFPYLQLAVLEENYSDFSDEEVAGYLSARSALVFDQEKNELLFAKNPEEILPMASLSKLMTALVFMEHNPGWKEVETFSQNDFVGGASLDLEPGDTVSVQDLFFSTLLASRNNAAMALSRCTGLSQEEFVRAMNLKARELNMNHTFFCEPTGLEQCNKTTAADYLNLSREALRNIVVLQATTMKSYPVKVINKQKVITVFNTNQLVYRDLFLTGGKTGYTDEAGHCLMSRARKSRESKQELIAVVMGADYGKTFDEVYFLMNNFLD